MIADNVIIGMISCPKESAEKLAEQMVESRLAACIQITSPIHSVYIWKGKLHKEEESLLLIKTTRTQVFMIKDFLKENHPYEVPEFLCFPAEDGLEEYMHWVENAFVAEE